MRKALIILIILTTYALSHAQDYKKLRTLHLKLETDTIRFDTLSIVPNSMKVYSTDSIIIHDTLYGINFFESLFITDSQFRKTFPEVIIFYRVLIIDFKESFHHKNPDSIRKLVTGKKEVFLYKPLTNQTNFFGIEGLSSSGSISRGVSIGNNQDASVNSTLNLQLSGKLSENLNIVAAITDNSIPIQPEGTTHNIQEFDKVYVQIFNDKVKLTAGDFDISNPKSHFMRFNKKAQGGLLETSMKLTDKEENITLTTSFAGAISKGRFARNTLVAIEGNQGPYKLRGDNNELYIVILAGTEKVYIDGRLLQRGQDYDYTIDYNTAEITFMPVNMITKDRRIIVEFEYSDKNYARSMFYTGNKIEGKRFQVQLNFFSEQDIKNQPQNQELTDSQKNLLSEIGDSLHLALDYNIDSMPFSNEYILYKMTDTLVNGLQYDTVFVYSTNPDSAFYRLGFTNIGQGKGNYIQEQSAANGRVFRWVAPVNGQMQGTHEPVVLLIAPQKQHMFVINAKYELSKTTSLYSEIAMSHQDINTFSEIDNKNNSGIGIKFGVENSKKLNNDTISRWFIKTSLNHEWTQKNFKPLERYRETEFERNWSVSELALSDEHLSIIKMNITDNQKNNVLYSFGSYFKPSLYNGFQNNLNASVYTKKYYLLFNGSLTNTNSILYNSSFIRQNTTLGRDLKWMSIGLKNEFERNEFMYKSSDTLASNSSNYEQYEVFVKNLESDKNSFNIFYRYRNDFHPMGNSFVLSSKAEETGISAGIQPIATQAIAIHSAYRKLYRISPFLMQQGIKPDDNLVGRLEYFSSYIKGVININTYYEMGSGLEIKSEFIYVEVPPGQGAYTWTDYNGNSIKELDEFEIATYQDQANYIRVFVPTNQYIKAYSNQFNQTVSINPAKIWQKTKGIKKFIARFSEQFTYQLSRKTNGLDLYQINPLYNEITDSNLISLNSFFRNTLSFNQQSSKFGIDYHFNNHSIKSLMVNGFESRMLSTHSIKSRLNFFKEFYFNVTGIKSLKTNASEFFTSRNYDLRIYELEPALSYQPNTNFRIGLTFKITEKENLFSVKNEKAYFRQLGTDFRYSKTEKGKLMCKVNYIQIGFNASTNTPLSYEMLEALQPGGNITWQINYQKNLKNNMLLSFLYDGRKAGENKVIHYGNIQLRAYF